MSTYSDFSSQRRADKVAAAEQKRLDRESEARIAANQQAAMAPHQIEAMRARWEHDQQVEGKRTADRARARRELWKRLRGDGLMTPVLLVSAVLSWAGMAVFGGLVYGVIGLILPIFTEGLFVAFAVRRRTAKAAGEPTAWLTVGLVFSGVVTAGSQIVHGLAGAEGAWWKAAIMATVSVSGVIAHQLIHAGPRLTAFERVQLRLDNQVRREAQQRIGAMRLAAVHQAVGEIDGAGNVALVFQPGLVALDTSRLPGRKPRLVEAITQQAAPEPAPVAPVTTVTQVDSAPAAIGADEIDLGYAELLQGSIARMTDHPVTDDVVVTAVTAAGQDTHEPTTVGGVVTAERPAGDDLAGWIRLAEQEIAADRLAVTDSQRTYREVLGCRMRMAARVQRHLQERTDTTRRRRTGDA